MKAIIIIIIGILISIVFIIGAAIIYSLRQHMKEIDRLFSEIEDIKQFLMID